MNWWARRGPCSNWPATTPSSGSNSDSRSGDSRPSATGWPTHWSRIEAADAALGAAWEERSPQAAATAKALAGRGARTAARHCQQVLAGIGFTTEHDLHRYVRRVLVLDQLLGTDRTLTRELGEELLATRRLPELPPL